MHTLRSTKRLRRARILAVLGFAGVALVGVATPAWAAPPATLTLSQTQGPNTGGGMITASTPAGTNTFFPGVDVEFQVAALATTPCAATYATPVNPTTSNGGILDVPFVMVISTNRIAINLPSFTPAPLTSRYNVCVYSTGAAGGLLLAQTASGGQFSIGARVSLGNVWPTAGPSLGGTFITVYGVNFPTVATVPPATPALTATLGGLPLQNITLVGQDKFTAITPPHAPSTVPVPLIVTTAAGSVVLNRAFTYSNGITVSPNTAPNTRMGTTPVDVQGVGFGALNFMMTGMPDDKNPHIYLVRGLYDPGSNNGNKRNGELVECANTMVVSDTELICNMNLQASLNSSGQSAMPTRTITADLNMDTTLAGITPALSASDQGERISGTGIAAGTVITAVGAGGTSATLSLPTQSTTNGVTGIAVGIGTGTASVTQPSNNNNPGSPPPPSLTGISPPLIQQGDPDKPSDVGKVVTGTGIPPGTTIMGIGPGGTTAFLSTQPTSAATGTTTPITISDPVPVPVGTYTLTVVSNGNVAAWPSDTNYTQSVLCSGATFTVSDF